MSDNAAKKYTKPNQREVIVERETPTGKKAYLSIYIDVLEAAASNLKQSGFKVYLYLACNKNGFRLAFSPADIHKKYNISEESIRMGFKELVEKGYLTRSETQKNLYVFHEVAQVKEERKEILFQGKIFTFTFEEILRGCSGDRAEAEKIWEKGEIK